jgi:hypothetical protein
MPYPSQIAMSHTATILVSRAVTFTPQHWSLSSQYRVLQRRTLMMLQIDHNNNMSSLRSHCPSLATTTTTTARATRSISFFSRQPSAEKKEQLETQKKDADYQSTKQKYSVYDHLTGYFQGRSQKENEAKMKAQIDLMAETEAWTLAHFEKTLDDQLKTWGARLSWFSGNKDLRLAKQAQQVVKSIIELVGKNATSDTIEKMGRKDKLKISYQSGASVEDINTLFVQFNTTSLMHKVIRTRKSTGQPVPHDTETLKLAMATDGRNLLTREQMKAWKARSFGNARSMLRSKRSDTTK